MVEKVTIEKMVHGGYGLARLSGRVVFVYDVLPGEIVTARQCGTVSGTPLYEPLDILESGAHRRTPPCPYSEECGGCDWLYIAPEQQIELKKQIFLECLERIGKIRDVGEVETFGAPEFGYRIRAQIKIGNGKAGFFRRGTHEIVDVQSCPLLSEPINSLLEPLRSEAAEEWENIRVISGTETCASEPVLEGLTKDYTWIQTGPYKFIVRGGSFFQNNRYLSQKMGSWAKESLCGESLLDLYGGVGFFAVMLGDKFRSGTLVESVSSQVKCAKENFRYNGFEHFGVKKAAIESLESDRQFGAVTFDCCVIDPPRSGLTPKARKWIASIASPRLLYFSCDPATQARDTAYFISRGYRIERTALFDLYPNTHHLETAIILKR